MQIKETPRAGYIQVVNNVYSAEKKRSVSVSIGSMSIFKPVPADLWDKLDADERIKLMGYIATKLKELNVGALKDFADALPHKLSELAGAWSVVSDNLGADRTAALVGEIEAGFKALKKAIRAAAPTNSRSL